MTLHVSRDFLSTGTSLTMQNPYMAGYLLSIFLVGVLGYTIVGSTTWNIASSPIKLTSGANGSLNQDVTDPYAFAPGNGYTVTAADIGRILVVKSPGNPMVNSGLFRVTGINAGSNWWYINYRSGDTPPAETGMTFALYENESVFVSEILTGGNGLSTQYQSQGTATASRIILQSPSSTGWQVRICYENSNDANANGGSVAPHESFGSTPTTVAPGFGGNTSGDFSPGGQHLHAPLFFNVHTTVYTGQTVSLYSGATGQCRYYFWGDDVTGTVFAASRVVIGTSDSMLHFGLPVNEEIPLPPQNAQRLFAIGANSPSNGGSNGIYFAAGYTNATSHGGASFGLSNQPISCTYSLYNPLFGSTFGGSSGNNPIRNSNNGGDNQYVASTELVPVDLIAGTYDNLQSTSSPESFVSEGRRLGQAPFLMMGRGNYGYFQVTTDPNKSWIHLNDGIYLPWRGSILP